MATKRLYFFLIVTIFILASTFLLIQFARGYRLDFAKKAFLPTGLLVATSEPDGAQVFVDNKLAGATNTTLSLGPDTYNVEIKKDGYYPWKKKIEVEKELVSKADAWLFLLVPNFRALTFTGAINPTLSPDGSKVVYQVNNGVVEKNGFWVLDLTDFPFGITREPKMIAANNLNLDLSKATYLWSPDSRQLLITYQQTAAKTQAKKEYNFILDVNNSNSETKLIESSNSTTFTLVQWKQEEKLKHDQKVIKLPKEMAEVIDTKTENVAFSPDQTKVLYTATASAALADNLIPPVAGASKQPQQRTLKPGQTYVYDIEEDRNFFILERNDKLNFRLSWFPNSTHLILTEKDKVSIVEYDGNNWTPVYNGAYQFPYAFPFPSANKLLILTSLVNNTNTTPNLYAVSLK